MNSKSFPQGRRLSQFGGFSFPFRKMGVGCGPSGSFTDPSASGSVTQ